MGGYPVWKALLGIPPAEYRVGPTVVQPPTPVLPTRSLEQITAEMIATQEGAVSPRDIRSLPAVAGAARLITSTIDQIPLRVNGGDPPPWLADPRSQAPNPKPGESAPWDLGDLIEHLVDSMIHHGAGYLACRRLAGDPVRWVLEAVDPHAVGLTRAYPNARGLAAGVVRRTFTVGGEPAREVPYTASTVGADETVLLHIPYIVTVDHPHGTTPLTQAANVLRGSVETEAHTSELFASGTHIGGMLSTESDITPQQAKDWQTAWIEARRARRIPVLGNGLTYRNDVPSGRDLQMVEARSFNQSVVWALLGIPMAYMGSSLMGGQSSLSYANAQDNRRQFADNCLRAFTTQIEDGISRLLPYGSRAAFDYTEWEGRADDGAATAPSGGVPAA